MRSALARATRMYGEHPLHLLALIGCFALAGYAVLQMGTDPSLPLIGLWFLGAVVAHDLVLFPLYALADRSVHEIMQRGHARFRLARLVSPVNYLRIPALASGLLLVLFFPGIIQQGSATYQAATGLTQQPFLGRWLLLTAVMFLVSSVIYALRLRTADAPRRELMKTAQTVVGRDERVLAAATGSDGRCAAVASREAFYHRIDESNSRWRRIGWEELDNTDWHPTEHALIITGLPGSSVLPTTLALLDPGRLPEIGHALITSTVITTRRVELGETGHATVALRHGADDRLVWAVHLADGLDPTDPEIQAHVDHALTTLRADLGVPKP